MSVLTPLVSDGHGIQNHICLTPEGRKYTHPVTVTQSPGVIFLLICNSEPFILPNLEACLT